MKADPESARAVLSDAAEVAYLLAGLLAPVVPRLADKLFEQLNAPALTFQKIADAKYPLLDRTRPIGIPGPLIGRLEEAQVSAVMSSPKESPPAAPAAQVDAQDVAREVEYAEFAKIILKVGKVLSAERVAKADKLLRLSVDVGEGSPRTIVSGIAEAYAPEPLVGRNVVVVTNLKSRVLRGIESRGMLLTAGPGGSKLTLIDPGDFPPGAEVK